MKYKKYWIILAIIMIGLGIILLIAKGKEDRNYAEDHSDLFVVNNINPNRSKSVFFEDRIHFSSDHIPLTYLGTHPIYILKHSYYGYGYQIRHEDFFRIDGDRIIFGVENDIDRYYQSIKNPTEDRSHVAVGLGIDGRIVMEKTLNAMGVAEQARYHQIYLDFFRSDAPNGRGGILQRLEPNVEAKFLITGVTNYPEFDIHTISDETKQAFEEIRYMQFNFFYLEDPLDFDGIIMKKDTPIAIEGFENYFNILRNHAKFASITIPVRFYDQSEDDEDIAILKEYGYSNEMFGNIRQTLSEIIEYYVAIQENNDPQSDEYKEAEYYLDWLDDIFYNDLLPFYDGLWKIYKNLYY